MGQEVTKIKIGINQKMNLGNYETRDYSIGIEIEGFDKDKVQDAIDFGRELCLNETHEYYKKVKKELMEGVILDKETKKEYLVLEDKIRKADNEEQLRTLSKKIERIEDVEMKKIMQKKFNLKLITLKNE